MLINLFSVSADDPVPGNVETMNSLTFGVTFAAAKGPLIGAKRRALLEKWFVARGADEGDLHAQQNTMPIAGWQ